MAKNTTWHLSGIAAFGSELANLRNRGTISGGDCGRSASSDRSITATAALESRSNGGHGPIQPRRNARKPDEIRPCRRCRNRLTFWYKVYRQCDLPPSGDRTVGSWKAGAQRMKGYAANEIIGQNYFPFFTEED